jgi:ASCH domain-containing protein
LRAGPAKKTEPELPNKRRAEKFVWKKGDLKLISVRLHGRHVKLEELPALSLRQPWAWLVVNGYKDIENRSWRTNHHGPLVIHASKNRSWTTEENLTAMEKKYDVGLPREFDSAGLLVWLR